jgi:lysine 2,3-aminomutase
MKLDNRRVKKFWDENMVLYGILRESKSPEIARNHLHNYLSEQWRMLYQKEGIRLSLEWSVQLAALRTFRRVISVRSEKLTGSSVVATLWHLANKRHHKLPRDLKQGFLEDIRHLLLAIAGKSNIYASVKEPDFMRASGRRAAVLRSRHLNRISRNCQARIARYPHGLQEATVARRHKNRARVLKVLGGREGDWGDFEWHLRNIIRDWKTLDKIVGLNGDEKKAIQKAKKAGLPFGITPYYASLMDRHVPGRADHAVRAQVIPGPDYVDTMIKHRADKEYSADFMMEKDTSPVDLVTRRYPFIAILKPYNTCSQICVYCQRNWEIRDVLDRSAVAPKAALDKALKWFRKNPEIDEVLVTGGDPFIMSTARINDLLMRLSRMKHVTRIRLGTRTPVVLPSRITDELVRTIAAYHQPGRREIAVVTHYEHVYEITPESMAAIQRLRKHGISVYNQAVYMVENSRQFELVALRRLLRLIGVDPYYTFNTKGKSETRRHRVPMARLQQEVKEEARLMPGLVRTDEPVYNVPKLGKNYVRAQQHHSLSTILPDGRRVYEFHPWEKNISLVDTYLDSDVPIYDYLQELKRRGENIRDYKSIWYYY